LGAIFCKDIYFVGSWKYLWGDFRVEKVCVKVKKIGKVVKKEIKSPSLGTTITLLVDKKAI